MATEKRQNRFTGKGCFGHFYGWGYFCCVDRAVRKPE